MSNIRQMPTASPLHDIRVLDMTRVVAGPYAAQILGDLGADVIKIERRGEGDDVRRVGPPWMKDAAGHDTSESTYFQAVNRNKRSIALDFAQPEGAKLVRELACKADVLLENYRPRTLDKYGLGYADLQKLNPRLIYCSISGFGQSGPYSGRSGYDFLVQAMSGLMSVTGLPDGEPGAGPIRVGVPIVDLCAAFNAVIGIQAALMRRQVSGAGQHIDVSLLESQLSGLINTFSAWFNAGTHLGRTGNDHPSAAPYGVYEVDDGHVLIATFNDREFGRLARLLDHPEWVDDPRFARNGARVAHRELLKELITKALRGKGKDEWVGLLNAGTVSCGPINTMADVEKDPHVQARGVVVPLEHPVTGTVKTSASAVRLSESPVTYRRAPPLMGEHTDEVLREWLGLEPEALQQLRDRQVI